MDIAVETRIKAPRCGARKDHGKESYKKWKLSIYVKTEYYAVSEDGSMRLGASVDTEKIAEDPYFVPLPSYHNVFGLWMCDQYR